MDDKHIDNLFREKLINHETIPSPSSWTKIEQKLEEKKKPVWLVWGKYAAGFLLLVGLGLIFRSWDTSIPDSGGKFVSEIRKNPSPQTNPPISEDKNTVMEETNSPTPQVTEKKSPKKLEPVKAPPLIIPSRQVASIPEVRIEESQPPIDLRDMDWAETLVVEELLLTENLEEIIPQIPASSSEIAYTVKIVSRGYAIAPDKGQLVDNIENKLEKIGGFFTKVDKGFADLQDAKNELFNQVLASRKER